MRSRKQVPASGAAPRARTWRAMRVLRTFTAAQLEATASVTRAQVLHLVKDLRRFKYVAVLQPGRGNQPPVYRLVKNTGPIVPIIGKDNHLHDCNLVNPFDAPVTKKIHRYGAAFLKMLRQIIAEVDTGPEMSPAPVLRLITEARELVHQHDQVHR